jgi:hypothetical protein
MSQIALASIAMTPVCGKVSGSIACGGPETCMIGKHMFLFNFVQGWYFFYISVGSMRILDVWILYRGYTGLPHLKKMPQL